MKFITDPTLLESPPETVKYDKGVEYHVPKVSKKGP
jgi:hypothetical protein